MSQWHIWTINPQKYKRVKEFLDRLPGISECFYPTVVKDYETKSGKKTKDVPLFNNYIFTKYEHNIQLHNEISNNNWIKDYIGKCSEKEMESVSALSNKRYGDLVPDSELQKGNTYKLIGTPFVDMECVVVDIDGDNLVVSIELFGSGRLIKCSINDIDLER
jgi:transcription antitermination factor NusG